MSEPDQKRPETETDTVNARREKPRTHAPPVSMDFDALFRTPAYLAFKRGLYSFVLRRRAVNRWCDPRKLTRVLDIGAGVSPVPGRETPAVITDISPRALLVLRRIRPAARLAAADGGNLPFKAGVFSHVVCSEVLEHIENDFQAIAEIRRVLKPRGRLLLTVPHRRALFAFDDGRVNHFRRYDIRDIRRMLRLAGFTAVSIQNVLGPSEKIVMYGFHRFLPLLQRLGPFRRGAAGRAPGPTAVFLFRLINRACIHLFRLEARLAPLSMASVILVHAVRREGAE